MAENQQHSQLDAKGQARRNFFRRAAKVGAAVAAGGLIASEVAQNVSESDRINAQRKRDLESGLLTLQSSFDGDQQGFGVAFTDTSNDPEMLGLIEKELLNGTKEPRETTYKKVANASEALLFAKYPSQNEAWIYNTARWIAYVGTRTPTIPSTLPINEVTPLEMFDDEFGAIQTLGTGLGYAIYRSKGQMLRDAATFDLPDTRDNPPQQQIQYPTYQDG